MVGTATFGAAYEGPPGCVHGGFVAAAFDEVLGSTQSLSGEPGMTGRLTVNYRSPRRCTPSCASRAGSTARGPQDLHRAALRRRPAVRGGRGPVHLDPPASSPSSRPSATAPGRGDAASAG